MSTLVARSYGGVPQIQVLDHNDLLRIHEVDPARWAATSAPVADLHCDPGFLACVDEDGKGRIRVSQVIAARDWLMARLAKKERVKDRSDVLRLADLQANAEGAAIRKAAAHLLSEIGKKDAQEVTLAEVRAFRAAFAGKLANGDGVICPETVGDEAVAAALKGIIATMGGVKDLSGKDGVSEATLAAFLDGEKAYLAWKAQPDGDKAILCWGPETAAASDMVAGLDAKIEEYFWVCDLLRQEAVSVEKLRLSGDDWKTFKSKDAATIERYIAESPLATPTPEGKLPLAGAVNPVYAERFEALSAKVLARSLGKGEKELTRASWRKTRALFDPYRAWQKAKPAQPFEKLALPGGSYISGETLAAIRRFIATDAAAKAELDQLSALEKVILFQRHLLELANNLVNFSAVYLTKETALVEMGSLVIDGRRLDFTVKVADRGAHKKVASESYIFLAYAEIRDKASDAVAFEIVAPVTAGERGRIRAGKRGIFIDVKGKEWDALVTDVVENPISLWEAMLAPFRRAGAFVAKKIEDMATSQLDAAEKGAQGNLDKGITAAATAPAPAPAPAPGAPPAPPPASGMQNMVLMGSLAFAAVGSALAFITEKLSSVELTGVARGIGFVVLLIAAIAGFLGWLKLRKRDMSLVLEANGWAVNAQMKITRRLGLLFTRRPAFPKGTTRDVLDLVPLAGESDEDDAEGEKGSPVLKGILLALFFGLAAATYCFFALPSFHDWAMKTLESWRSAK